MDPWAAPWRLLLTDPRPGAWNMACDEALLWAHAQGQSPPTVRFYRWQPPCLSLGYAQSFSRSVRADVCARLGIDIVRRLTGGRAILHDAELTYSVVVREELLGVGPGILPAYRHLSQGLLLGLRRLGVEASLVGRAREAARRAGAADPACFAAAAACDLVVGQVKLVGSAQARKWGAILQHGSLLLRPDRTRLDAVLQRPPGAGGEAWTSLSELGVTCSWEELTAALAAGFAEALNVSFEPAPCSPAEQAHTEALATQKYATRAWRERVP